MKLGEANAQLLSHHNSFVMILNAALSTKDSKGGKPSGPDPSAKRVDQGHATVEDAVAAINAALTFG